MYNGIVNVYKEQGFTSHDVVAKLRGVFGQKKIGHTGTLDPMAEGVLIVCLGQATKLSDMILTSRKSYIATMKLGIVTTTDDTTGEVKKSCDAAKLEKLFSDRDILEKNILELLDSFHGKSMQIPPMYSAIKVNGKKLYEYARAGIEIEREPRPVEIFRLELKGINSETREISFAVECSKGTYIRSLIRDMGERLETGAAMSMLIRDEVNGIKAEDGYKISDLQAMKEEGRLNEAVLPMDELLKNSPAVSIKESGMKLLSNGNRLREENLECQRSGSGESDTMSILKDSEFFRVYVGDELKALYAYDSSSDDYKVYKMLNV
ncbi:MAG: tRNA pseudouridine(55) synthase TruB [Eubacterium sp.]|nr:tRNA pseudouridine(55) synthase TruB [Eubacterium sp.]